MKRIVLAAAAALCMLGTAQAQTARASSLYGEIGYTFHDVKVDTGVAGIGSVGFDPQSIRGIIGYNVHPYFAVEGMVDLGTKSDDGLKVKNAFGVFIKPKYDINSFELFGRLGFARTKVRVSGGGLSASDSTSDLAYGVGVNYNINPRTYVGVDYLRLRDKHDVKVDGVTVGVGFRF